MALWQFITFSGLIGAVLLYTGVITRRLGRAEARLSEIEATLLAKAHTVDSAPAPAAATKPQVPDNPENRGAYLTLRDLRVRSEQRAIQGIRETPKRRSDELMAAIFERRHAPATGSEPLNLPTMRAVSADSTPTSLERHDAPASEPLNLPTMRTTSEEPEATSSEGREARGTHIGTESPSADRRPSDDSVAQKERDTVLFLSTQRRRRRARLGY